MHKKEFGVLHIHTRGLVVQLRSFCVVDMGLLFAYVFWLIAGTTDASDTSTAADGWRLATGTYYGAPASVAQPYDPSRGEGSFGILAFGSCGFTEYDRRSAGFTASQTGITEETVAGNARIPFPANAVGAAADGNPDYAGSCGRCYKVRCKSGLVRDNDAGRTPLKIINGLYGGDRFRPYLPAINPNVPDTKGKQFPGNTAEQYGLQFTQCYDDSKEITIRIIDSCPCTQKLTGETRTQEWCCNRPGGLAHFDLGYPAFEELAHPVYGVMMMEYRPVDCNTGQTLNFEPGYISPTIYGSSGTEAGWSWWPFDAASADYAVEGSPTGGKATCIVATKGGGIGFNCRNCEQSGYRPFEGKSSLDFWVKADKGGPPPLKVFLVKENGKVYCRSEVKLQDTTPKATSGSWSQFSLPLAGFGCGTLGDMTRVDFQNVVDSETAFCLARIEIV